MVNYQFIRKILLSSIMLLFGLVGCTIIDDNNNPDKPVEMIELTIDSMKYDKREVQYGTFTTKKEMREYIDIVYTNDVANETKSVSVNKKRIKIGDETKVELPADYSEYTEPTVTLSKELYLDYFHDDDVELDSNDQDIIERTLHFENEL